MAVAGANLANEPWLGKLGEEKQGTSKEFYLITFSRILADTLGAAAGALRDVANLTRAQISTMVRNAFNDPLRVHARGGRPRQQNGNIVRKIVVFMETHADGSKHFHAAVYLFCRMRWEGSKRTLRLRKKLAVHFSSSHDGWWSVLRYGTELSKKDDVDDKPHVWLARGEALDIFEESQQPYQAKAWVARREKKDIKAAKADKTATFTKLDFTSLVLAKGLSSRAQVLRYVQEHGTVAMQVFVSNNQKKLNDFLEDAWEWKLAKGIADKEDITDWALLCTAAEADCPHGPDCRYSQVAKEILEKNSANFSQQHLAAAIRKVITMGPCKVARIPFLAGPTNTGKSTLVDSVDDLFH